MKDGCLCDRGECLKLSAKLDRWPIAWFGLGLDVLRLEGGSIEDAGSAISRLW